MLPVRNTPVITPVIRYRDWWAKREDSACYQGPEYPSGSKFRLYLRLAKIKPGAPLVIGCSACSSMQLCVAAVARITGVKGVIFTAMRGQRTDATAYAASLGATINEVSPGYLSLCRKRASIYTSSLPSYVAWDEKLAIAEALEQCVNIPPGVRRVVVPAGSGLTASAVLAGLTRQGRADTPVLAVQVSGMASKDSIVKVASGLTNRPLPMLTVVRATGAYDRSAVAALPDGTPLDPYYAAKAIPFLQTDDLLWVPGLRPVAAMPVECRRAFAGWNGIGMPATARTTH